MSEEDGAKRPPAETSSALTTRSAPYPMSRLAPRFDLVDLAKEIERADATIAVVTSAKLELLRDQMRALQEKAREILEESELAARLHRIKCNFPKRPGAILHLYVRPNGERYFSMLSPEDWKAAPPHAFEGSYRLEIDQSFTRVDA